MKDSSHRTRALVFVNDKASQGAANYSRVASALEARGFIVIKGEAVNSESYTEAIRTRREEVDLVVLGGGDGTLRCAAEILMETKLPLGIVPLGTANNVARSLRLPLSIDEACEVIANGTQARMDLARVNGRIFVSVVGMGFSTDVHDEVLHEHKKRWGSLSYAFQALRMLMRPRRYFYADITCDDQKLRVKALQVTVCNGRFYGAHVQVHPEATLDDGLLDLSVIESGNFVTGFLRALLLRVTGSKPKSLRLARSTHFEIVTQPVRKLDVEGETDLVTPAKFEVLPAALRVMVPQR